jgi:tRNA threonylcarbamoyladenosine biosynthesis protein TsaE
LHANDDSGHALDLHLADEAATTGLGSAVAYCVAPGMTVFLSGDLGSGKTTLARGLIQALGYKGKVKSPTFTLVELYVIFGLYLYHFDFYRFRDSRELSDAGFREHFNERSLCLVEWPEKARGKLPAPDLKIELEIDATGGRNARLSSETETGHRCIVALKRRL